MTDSGTTEQALARDDVELIVNLTVPAAHAEVASAALAAGKHVFNEKPIAPDLASAEALVAQADAAGLRLGCAPRTRSWGRAADHAPADRGRRHRPPLTASVVMQSGRAPSSGTRTRTSSTSAGAGPLLDMGPYYLTALAQAFGPVARVVGAGRNAGPTGPSAQGPRAGRGVRRRGADLRRSALRVRDRWRRPGDVQLRLAVKRMGVVEIAGAEATLARPDPNTFAGEIRDRPRRRRSGRHPGRRRRGGRGIGAVEMARAIRSGGPHRANGRRPARPGRDAGHRDPQSRPPRSSRSQRAASIPLPRPGGLEDHGAARCAG